MRKSFFKPRRSIIAVAVLAAIGSTTAPAANVTWVGPNDSFWDLPANWNPGLPLAPDDVLLGAFNTEFRSGSVSIRSFTGTGTLRVTGGTLLFTDTSSTGGFFMSAGQLTGTGNLTVTGAATMSLGALSGSGTTTLQGTTTISGTGLRLDGGRVLSNAGTLTQSGSVDLNSRNLGLAEAGNGSVLNAAGGTWTSSIAAGTNFILASNQGAGDTGAGATFTNAGTFNKQGPGTTDVRTNFVNDGSLNVQAGQLQFGVGGGALTHNGALTIAAGAVLDFAGNTAVTQTINTAATTIAGTLSITGDNFVNFTTPHTISGTGTFQHSFGQVIGSNLTLGPALTVNITDGSYSGAATTTVQGATTISSTGLRLDGGRIFRNEGTVTQTGGVDMNSRRSGAAEAGNGSVLNAAGGTWTSSIAAGTNFILASNQGAGDTGAGATFTNAGTFNKQGPGTTDVRTNFVNDGSLNVQAGQLQFGVGGGALTHNGALTIAAGAVLDFAGNTAVTQTINTAATTIAGTLSITGDNFVNFTTPHTISGTGTFQHSFGQVIGSNLTLGPALTVNITDGSYSGAATTTVQGATTISSTGLRLDGGRIFRNEGTVTQTGGVDMNSRRSGAAEAGNGSVLNAAGGTWTSSIAAGTNFILASNQGAGDTGAGATFTNAGTFNKQGPGTTDVRTNFVNDGSLNVQAGQLQFGVGGGALTHNGALTIAAGAVLDFAGNTAVTQTINTAATTIAGTLSITGDNFVNFTTPHTISGTGTFQHSFGQVIGSNLTLGPALTVNITDGSYSGAATTTVQGATTISSTGLRLDGGRIFRNEGTVTQTGGVDMNSRRSGAAEAGNGSVLNAAGGTWTSSIAAGTNFILASNQGAGDTGAGATFTNAGTFNKQGPGTTDVRTNFVNDGSLNVQAGQLQFGVGGGALTHNGALTIAAGAVLDFAGNTAVTQTINTAATTIAGTLSITGDNFVNFTTPHTISGTGTFQHSFGQVIGSNLTLGPALTVNITDGSYSGAATTTVQGATTISSTGLRLDGGRIFRNEGTVTQTGGVDMNSRRSGAAEAGNGSVLNAAGGTWTSSIAAGTNFILASNQGAGDTGAGATFTNAGTFNKQGPGTTDVRTAFNNSGLVDVQTGTLTFVNGGVLQGTTGTLQIGPSGTVQLNSPASTGNLFHNGSAANSLQLGTVGTVTVHTDYNNANFAVGNAFNRRANVNVTAGGPAQRLLAGGDANQGVSGANIVNGNTTTPAIVIGNVRVGANTFTYDIANTGTTGPSLRGAIQTNVNGGNITDARLSGNGVTAGNWGPVATGGSLSRDVIVTVNNAGVFTPLAGQAVSIVNNFENTRSQLLTIQSAAGAAAYRVAAPVVTGNLDFGNVLVGSTQERFVTVSNSALADGFSEGLNAAFGSITGTGASLLTGSGSLTNLVAGASNNTTLRVTLNTSASGSVNASVEVVLASNGATTSGLGTLALPSQFLASLAAITGQVGVLAQGSTTPTLVNAGNVRIGTGVGQVLTVSNVAVGPAEGLNASFGANTGNVANNGGIITSLPAGTANNASMSVSLDTSVAGARSGTATVNYVSDGSFNGGVTTPVGSEAVTLQANVFRLAQGSAADPVNLGNFRVGNAVSGSINVTNTAAADGFSERLNANVTGTGGAVSGTTGSVALLNAGSSSNLISATIGSGVAGANSGTVTLAYQSDGTGTTGASAIGVGGQTVNVQATGWNVATGNATPTPVNLGNFHVGGAAPAAQNLAVANQAPAAFSEQLGIQSANATGPFTATNNLGAGRVDGGASAANAIAVGLGAGGVAGANTGTVSIQYLSDGSAPGNSGFAATNSNLQNLSVNATGYRLATYDLGTLNFGNVLVGSGLTSRTLSVTNTQIADAFSEGLNARFGTLTNSGAGILSDISSAITNLLAGQSNNSSLQVRLDPTTQGGINGSIQVILESNGATTSGLGITALGTENIVITGTITGQAGVLAQGSTTPTLVNAGNVRIGTGVGQVLTVSNVAVGPAEGLSASFGANTGNVANNGGTITSLPAGTANNTSMSVSLDTSVAGARSGTATVNYVSDGSFNSGVTTPVGSEAVTLQANVFRLANPVVNTPSVTLAARVGDAAPSAGISITNSSPDTFTEGLKASVASTPAGFAGSGAIANLAAQGTDGSTLRVALNTGTAGTFSGNAALALESTGAGTTGAPDLALPGQNVAVSGKVYTPAVASVSPGALNFGIVHVGDVVADKAVTVANAAPVTALNDVLRGSIAAGGPFNATGTLGAGVAAGASDSTSLKVGLSTAVSGVFAGPATLGLLSHNDDMSDLPLPDVLVQLSAQVNNFANPVFVKTGGSGNLSRVGSVFTLDFGDLALGGSAASALGVLNDVFGPADLLDGAFDTSGVDDFLLSGFASFTGLDAGDLFSGLLASFDALVVGGYTDTVGLRARGYNASGFEEFFNLSLVLRADVGQPSTVPEPGSLALVALAIASALVFRRRTRHTIARR